MRETFPDLALVVDADLGMPGHAAQTVEMGCGAGMLKTAVTQANDPAATAGGLAAKTGPAP